MDRDELANTLYLKKFLRAIQAARTLDEQLGLQTLAALVTVALEEGQTVASIGKRAEIGQSSTTRNLRALSDKHWIPSKQAYQLIEYRDNPLNASSKLLHLTKKGHQFIDHLSFILKA